MKLICVIFLCILLSGCSTAPKMEVIQPQTAIEKQPKLRWVTREILPTWK